MSIKGKVFSRDDLPAATKRRLPNMTKEQLAEVDQLLEAKTHRFAIVAYDGEMPLIAEELDERALRKLPEGVREIATQMLRLTPEMRLAVLGAFDKKGELRLPFKFAK